MDMKISPVVMAGGVGSRLWPLSRAAFPKQYQVLVENEGSLTMLQQTFARLGGLSLGTSQLICNQEQHFLAAEHWVVGEGVAKVHVDGVDRMLQANDSVYIPKGAVHCLANETKLPLHLVEVQSGSYLGEDDIERLDDIYGRC